MQVDNGKILVTESNVGKLYLYYDEYNGHNLLHLRYWFQDKKDGVWKPGKKGIAVPEEKVRNVLEALKLLLSSQASSEDAVSVYGG
jgi:hypothetical protein